MTEDSIISFIKDVGFPIVAYLLILALYSNMSKKFIQIKEQGDRRYQELIKKILETNEEKNRYTVQNETQDQRDLNLYDEQRLERIMDEINKIIESIDNNEFATPDIRPSIRKMASSIRFMIEKMNE